MAKKGLLNWKKARPIGGEVMVAELTSDLELGDKQLVAGDFIIQREDEQGKILVEGMSAPEFASRYEVVERKPRKTKAPAETQPEPVATEATVGT